MRLKNTINSQNRTLNGCFEILLHKSQPFRSSVFNRVWPYPTLLQIVPLHILKINLSYFTQYDLQNLKFSCLYLFPFAHKVVPQKASGSGGGGGGVVYHTSTGQYIGVATFFYLDPG